MNSTRLFQSNRSQALRLSKDVAFPAGVREVTIIREGARRVVVPSSAVWDDFFDAPGIDIEVAAQPRAEDRDTF